MKTNNIFGFFALLIALLATTTVCNAQKTVTLKHWNGNLAETTPYDAQGNLHGTQTLYNVQGIKTKQNVWQHGKLSKTTMFFKSGAIAEQTTYNDVERDQKFEYIKYDMIAGRRIKVKHQKWNPKNFDMTIMLQEYDYTTKTLNNVIGELPNGKGIYATNNFPGYPQYKELYYDNDTAMVWMSKDKKVFYGKQPKFESMILSDTYYYIYDEAGNITYDGVAKRLEQERLARQKVIDDSLAIVRQQREAFVRDSIAKAKEQARIEQRKTDIANEIAKFDDIERLQFAYVSMIDTKFAGDEVKFFKLLIKFAKDKKQVSNPLQSKLHRLLKCSDIERTRKADMTAVMRTNVTNRNQTFAGIKCKFQYTSSSYDSPQFLFVDSSTINKCKEALSDPKTLTDTKLLCWTTQKALLKVKDKQFAYIEDVKLLLEIAQQLTM